MSSKQVKEIRRKLNMSQQQFAKRIVVSRELVSQWETGRKKVRPVYVQILEGLLEKGVAG